MSCPGKIDVAGSLADGELRVSGSTMHTPAYAPVDLTELWEGPDQRGDDLMIPGAPGVLPMPRRADVSERRVHMVIDGSVAYTGAVWSNEREGLRRNVARIRSIASDPTGVGDGTRAITLTSPDGLTTLSGYAHVSLKVGAKTKGLWRAELVLSLPSGYLA